MDDLVKWLRAQLDEDERVARAAQLGDRGEWERGDRSPTGGTDVWDLNSRSDKPDRGFYRIADGLDPEVVDHIARYDPARVLADVDAKRKLLECLVGATGKGTSRLVANDEPWAIGGDHLVKLLALPYAGREGYRDEWKP